MEMIWRKSDAGGLFGHGSDIGILYWQTYDRRSVSVTVELTSMFLQQESTLVTPF